MPKTQGNKVFFLGFLILLSSPLLLAQDWKQLNKQAEKQYAQGKYQQTVETLRKALIKGKQQRFDKEAESLISEFLAKVYVELGHYEAAEPLYLNVQKLRASYLSINHLDYATSLENLALLYQLMGKYAKAEPLLQQSLGIREQTTSTLHPDYAHALEQLAYLYEQLGIYEKAETYYLQVQLIKEQTIGKKNAEYATTLHNIAGLYTQLKKYKEAENLYEESLKITEKIEGIETSNYATSLEDLAYLYLKMNELEKAEKIFKQGLAINLKVNGTQHPEYALTINNLAKVYEQNRKWQQADSLYQISLSAIEKYFGKKHIFYTNTLYNAARLLDNNNFDVRAEQLYLQVLEQKHQEIAQVFPALSEKEKIQFYQATLSFFNTFHTFALKRHQQNPKILQDVFDNQLLLKGLLFEDYQNIKTVGLNHLDTTTNRLYENWQEKRDLLAHLYYRNVNSSQQQSQLNEEKAILEKEVESLEKQLAMTAAKKVLMSQQTENWQILQQQLKENEVLLDIIRVVDSQGDSCKYICLITTHQTKENPAIVVLTNGNELENSAFKFYQYSLRELRTDAESYTLYWQPIKQKIKELTQTNNKNVKIYLCPDGVYYQINLHSLLNPETGEYILDESNILLLGNCNEVLDRSNRVLDKNNVKMALFGCPILDLPAAQTEIEQITQVLDKNNYINYQTYMDSTATEENLKALDQPTLLHIATHGFFSQDIPNGQSNEIHPLLQSGLYLVKNKKSKKDNTINEDGILTGMEVTNLNLSQTNLVVLSACETGVGQVQQGEGVFGLQRAFLSAGAEMILMSLWKVHDRATQLLMVAFYDEWLKTGNTLLSFTHAQQTVRTKYPHPYYWGAFVITE